MGRLQEKGDRISRVRASIQLVSGGDFGSREEESTVSSERGGVFVYMMQSRGVEAAHGAGANKDEIRSAMARMVS